VVVPGAPRHLGSVKEWRRSTRSSLSVELDGFLGGLRLEGGIEDRQKHKSETPTWRECAQRAMVEDERCADDFFDDAPPPP
jgi:hypothetical protein